MRTTTQQTAELPRQLGATGAVFRFHQRKGAIALKPRLADMLTVHGVHRIAPDLSDRCARYHGPQCIDFELYKASRPRNIGRALSLVPEEGWVRLVDPVR